MIGTIKIGGLPQHGNGQIGAYEKDGKTLGVTLIDVISQFKALPEGTRIVNIDISSPGGLVDEGDAIYEYIKSEKKNYVINTVQVGDIASIATKLFLVGDSRKANPKFKFMIHNPWTDPGPGDSKYQAEVLEGLLQSEAALRKFYSKELNITEEGLAPLMDRETFMTGEQLLSLGFATQLTANIPVMAMKKEGEKQLTLTQRIVALAESITGKKAEGAKALDVALADNRTLVVEAADESNLVGATAMLDGAPAPDGDYPTAPDEDGTSDVLTVAGGLVTAVKEMPSSMDDDEMKELKANVASLTEAVAALVEAGKAQAEASEKKAEAAVEAKIMALRGEIGTVHNPKKAATVYAESVDKTEKTFMTISQRMAQKAEARKKQVNG